MSLKLVYLLLALLLLGGASANTRATWLTTYDSAIKSLDAAVSTLTYFQGLGITKVYVSVWNNGNLYANSSTFKNFVGYENADYLGNVVDAARQVGGISVVAWFEYGNMAAYGGVQNSFSKNAQQKGWLIGNGQLAHNFVWLDPGNQEAADFLVSMVTDVHNNYADPYFGVQFDDHLAYPISLQGPSNSLRENQVSSLVHAISQAVGASYFSIAPNIMPNSLSQYNANWPNWVSNFWVYEVVPQTYRTTTSQFNSVLSTQLNYVDASKLIAGIRCDGSGTMTEWSEVSGMISSAETQGLKGECIWYAACITSQDEYASEFQTLWGESMEKNSTGRAFLQH